VDQVRIASTSKQIWYFSPSSYQFYLSLNPPANSSIFTLHYNLWFADGSVSLEAANKPGYFIVEYDDCLYLHEMDGSSDFGNAASFYLKYDEWREETVSFEARGQNGTYVVRDGSQLCLNSIENLGTSVEQFGLVASHVLNFIVPVSNSTAEEAENIGPLLVANIVICIISLIVTIITTVILIRQGISVSMVVGMDVGMLVGMGVGMYVGMLVYGDLGMLVGMVVGMIAGMGIGMGVVSCGMWVVGKVKDEDYKLL